MTPQTLTGRLFVSICNDILQCGNCIFGPRAVFGYDGKSNDLKVSETGGMSYGSCFFFSNIFIVFNTLFPYYETENVSWVILYLIGEYQVFLRFETTICRTWCLHACICWKGCEQLWCPKFFFWKTVALHVETAHAVLLFNSVSLWIEHCMI